MRLPARRVRKRKVLEYATGLGELPVASLTATKRLMLEARRPAEEIEAAHAREMAAFDGLMGGPANRLAMKAFAEKRKPDFSKL